MARVAGDLSLAEDCAQEACVAALEQWPRDGLPANPGGWVVAVARHRALDHLRRESARAGKERQAAREWTAAELDGSAIAAVVYSNSPSICMNSGVPGAGPASGSP